MNYIGSTISRDDSWLLELTQVPEELREEESSLMQSRWFDYRNLLPAQATYRFAFYYDTIYRDYFAMTRDIESSEEAMSRVVDDVFKGSDLISIWKARQDADRIGCKYTFYLSFIFRRVWDRGHRMLPRPNQLYSEELSLDIKDAWEHALQNSLQLADAGFLKPGQYCGHPDQDAYYTYLADQAKKREHQHMILSRLVFREKLLPREFASKYFSSDVLTRAENF